MSKLNKIITLNKNHWPLKIKWWEHVTDVGRLEDRLASWVEGTEWGNCKQPAQSSDLWWVTGVWIWLGSFFLGGLRGFAGRNQHLTWWQSAADLPHPDKGPSTILGQAGMEQSPQRAGDWPCSGSGFKWSTHLAFIKTPDFDIWNSGSYSRDIANLWLRNTGHTSGFPWSQECGLHGSSLHMAHTRGYHRPSSIINQVL